MEENTKTETASYEHYISNPEMYTKRSTPDRLNWGIWMDEEELKKAKLVGNRVTLPGDFDYFGNFTEIST